MPQGEEVRHGSVPGRAGFDLPCTAGLDVAEASPKPCELAAQSPAVHSGPWTWGLSVDFLDSADQRKKGIKKKKSHGCQGDHFKHIF